MMYLRFCVIGISNYSLRNFCSYDAITYEQLRLQGGVTHSVRNLYTAEKEDEDKQQNESESIQNQKSLLVHYAVERGWDIYHIYCDEDYSGADSLRPDFNKMLSAKEYRMFQITLCKFQPHLGAFRCHSEPPLHSLRVKRKAGNAV